ncbi:SDR family oxidoreductase [Conexibacter sp. DBS9H8]|uniref:SDR family NAD(P)-dependent oxidoreductase n=1 Tax=Conexibacter sp. DBS9H8 TaxID=2937801 RepID=UPI002010757E|nr:SDR family NAD(P)-dependent oxidoreductase [Conexibacter sp. DBS9H8]
MDLRGCTALVTGASRGIGLALVAELAKRDMKVVLAGVREPERFEPMTDRASVVRPVHLDLSSRDSIEECCAAMGEELNQIDLLIHNAGLMTGGLIEEQDTEAFYALFQVNLVAVAHLSQKVIPGMLARGRGKIVMNGSIGSYAVFPAVSTYAAAKTGMVVLSEAMRRELRDTGVEVMHLVTPSVDTVLLDDTEAIFGRYMDTSKWERMSPADWAVEAVTGIEADEHVVLPKGATAIARLVRREGVFPLDPLSDRTFNRQPRC